MMELSNAIYDKIVANVEITDLLGEYDDGKSVIIFRPVPPNAKLPMILAATTVSSVNEDFLASDVPVIRRDVAVYGNAKDHFLVVNEIATRLFGLFNRASFPVEGWHLASCRATIPMDAPSDEGEIGKIVTLSIRLHRRRN